MGGTLSDGASSGYDSTASTGSKCVCNHAEVGGGARNTTRNTASNGSAHHDIGPEMSSVLRDGRVQALIEGLWTKVVSNSILLTCTSLHILDTMLCAIHVSNTYCKLNQDNAEVLTRRMKEEMDGYRSTMSRIEATLSQVAGTAQMETLGLVVEEQRRRIDSILTGSGYFCTICLVKHRFDVLDM